MCNIINLEAYTFYNIKYFQTQYFNTSIYKLRPLYKFNSNVILILNNLLTDNVGDLGFGKMLYDWSETRHIVYNLNTFCHLCVKCRLN